MRATETDWEISFREIRFEKAVFDRPAFDQHSGESDC
jgi:hypothetical protein